MQQEMAMSDLHRVPDAIEAEPEAEQLLDLALTDLSLGNHGQAGQRLQSALDTQPEYAHLYWKIGNAFLDLGKPENADAAYETGITHFPHDTWLRFFHARAAEVRGAWQEVIDRASRFRDVAPQDTKSYRLLASAYAAQGRFDVAERHARRSVALAPDDCWSAHQDAELSASRGDLDRAIERFQDLTRRLPEHRPAAARLRDLERQRDKARVESLLDKASAEMAAGRHDEALATLREAAGSCAGQSNLIWRTANLFVASGRPDEAEALLEAGVRNDPRDPWLLYYHAHAAETRGDWPAVIERAMRLCDLVPMDAKGYRLLATAHAALGALDVAESYSHRSVELAPDDCWAVHHRAELALTQKRPEVAIARFQELVTQFPQHIPGYTRLDKIVLENSENAAVAATLLAGAQNHPDSDVFVLNYIRIAIGREDSRHLFKLLTRINKFSQWYRSEYHHICFKILTSLHDDPMASGTLIDILLQEEDDHSTAWRPQLLADLTGTFHIAESPVHHVWPVVRRYVESLPPRPDDSIVLNSVRLILGLVPDESTALSYLKSVARRGQSRLLFVVSSLITPGMASLVRRYREEVIATDFSTSPPSEPEIAALLLLSHQYDQQGLFSLCRVLKEAGLPKRPFTIAEPAAFIDAMIRSYASAEQAPPAPFLAETRPLRIALCISGQLRGFKKAYPTWPNLGFEKHTIHCFVHVWRNIGRAISTMAQRGFPERFRAAYAEAYAKYGLHEFHRSFPGLFRFMNTDSTVTEEELCNFYSTKHVRVEDDTVPPFSTFINPKKMYHKINSCYELMESSGHEFDLIIRIRPDREINKSCVDWNEIHHESAKYRRVFVDHPKTLNPLLGHVIGDQFGVGCPDVMSTYSKTYQSTQAMMQANAYGFPRDFEPHTNLAYTLLWNGISVERIRGLEFGGYLPPDNIPPNVLLAVLKEDVRGQSTLNELQRLLLTACEADCFAT